MIDLDQMDARLEKAVRGGGRRPVTPKSPATPAVAPPRRRARPATAAPAAPPVRPVAPSPGSRGAVRALVELGHLEQADAEIAAVSRRTGDPSARRDALTWTTMRALLDGRAAEVTAGLAALRSLATESGDAAALDRYWTQRWWAAVERGDEADRFDVVDHCRERAYRFDDLPWWGALCVSLAGLGRADEAARAFDETLRLLEAPVADEVRLDVVSNLVEAAAVLGYNRRTVAAAAAVDWPDGRLVVTGPAVLCKGSVDRYRGLGLAAAGRPEAAAECFRTAAEVHRAIGAGPLLDRTHRQAERIRRTA